MGTDTAECAVCIASKPCGCNHSSHRAVKPQATSFRFYDARNVFYANKLAL
ncbi:hypothetical protein T03_3278 [Trichinella britovi]|uniref:Uncharacterized protein n=1 Tax=Trichinella britovi TaxID=45882 RepID=A0A0V1C9H3_TRIBR|nr:hypothetical protein T03_3278 [Trichinella britovi]